MHAQKHLRGSSKALLLIGTGLLPHAVVAQVATPNAVDGSRTVASATAEDTAAAVEGDIVVTAQRRSQSIQRVPISITAISAETIQRSRVEGIEQVFARAPNVSFTSGGSRDRKELAIRGISNQLDPNNDVRPATYAFYIDDFNVVAGTSNPQVLDLQRIEVLRGPQGTYFGRNSLGGAINISTQKPTNAWEGSVELDYGRFDTKKVAAVLNVPIVEGILSVRAAGQIASSDGYIKNINPIGGGNNTNYKTGRIIARLTPIDGLTSDTTFSYSREVNGMRDGVPTGFLTATWRRVYYNNAVGNVASPDGVGFYPDNRDRVNYNRPQQVGTKFWYASNRTEYDFGGASLVAVGGYLKADVFNFGDVDGGSLDAFYEDNALTRDSLSGELRLQSNGDRSFQWTVGAMLGKDTGATDQSTFYGNQNPLGRPPSSEISGVDSSAKNTYQAIFAQATWRFAEQWSAIVGGRYSHERVSRKYLRRSNGLITDNIDRGKTFNDFSPKFTLTYDPSSTFLIYTTVSRGFKSGGVQIGQLSLQQDYKPEVLWNYEAGLKFSAFDRRLRADVSGFYIDWSNVQQAARFQFINAAGSLISVNGIDNAAKAHSYGLDGSLDLRVTDQLTLNAFGGWNIAKYGSYGAALVDGVNVNATGARLINAPKWTAGAVVDYREPLSANVDGFTRLEYNYRSKINSSVLALRYINSPFVATGFSNVNLRAGIEYKSYRVTVYVENLLDENYYSSAYEKSFYSGVQVDPSVRRFGVSIGYKF